MTYTRIIEDLRNKKQLSMKEICGKKVSHSTYSRFIKKGQEISIDRLIYILSNMDLTFREAGLFNNAIDEINELKIKVNQTIQKQDHIEMMKLAKKLERQSKRRFDAFHRLAIQLNLAGTPDTVSQQTEELINYLFQAKNWNYTEMYLFSLVLNSVPSSVIIAYAKRCYKRRAPELKIERNLNLIIFLEEAHFELLLRHEYKDAIKLYRILTQLTENQKYTTVRAWYLISTLIHQLAISSNNRLYEKIMDVYELFLWIEMPPLANKLKNRYQLMSEHYKLPNWTVLKK